MQNCENRLSALSSLSVCPPHSHTAWNNSDATRRSVVKFFIRLFFHILSQYPSSINISHNSCTLHADRCTFMVIYRAFRLTMRNAWQILQRKPNKFNIQQLSLRKFNIPLKIPLLPLRYSRWIKFKMKTSCFKSHFNIIAAHTYVSLQASLYNILLQILLQHACFKPLQVHLGFDRNPSWMLSTAFRFLTSYLWRPVTGQLVTDVSE